MIDEGEDQVEELDMPKDKKGKQVRSLLRSPSWCGRLSEMAPIDSFWRCGHVGRRVSLEGGFSGVRCSNMASVSLSHPAACGTPDVEL